MKYRNLISMYVYYFLRRYSKGITDNLSAAIDNDKYEETYDKLISKDYIIKLYHVTDFPRQLPQSLTNILRKCAPKGCYIDITTLVDREVIDWSSPYMSRVKKTWENSIKKNPANINKNSLNSAEDYQLSSKTNDAIDSWNLVSRKTSEGHSTVRTEINIMCFFRKPISIRDLIQKEQIYISNCKEKGVVITPLSGEVANYLQTICPTSVPQRQPVKQFSTMLDENIALFETYTSGKIGGKKIYLGREIDYHMFVFEDLLNTKGGALNILIVASTGSGKSFYIKFLTEIFLDSRINVIVWDKDGEYEELAKKQNMVTINLGSEGGKYYNTVPIPLLVPNGMTSSINDTLAIFEMLSDVDNGMTSFERFVFNLAYNYMFEAIGIVSTDKTTWSKSHSLTYKDVYKAILEISDQIPVQERHAYESFCRKLFIYFDPKGMHSQIFAEALDIEDILSHKELKQPLMICINMQSKNNPDKETIAKLLDRIKSHTMSNVSTRVIEYNKSVGEFTALIVEEVNRHMDNKNFITMVNDEVTGGRKKNLIPILVTNSIQRMANSDNKALQDILDNMDTIIVGALNSNASKLVQERYSLQSCSSILEQMQDASTKDVDSKYKNAFLVRTRSELAVIKATVPPHLAKSDIFATRTIEEEEEE